MKVYVVLHGERYEGGSVVSVHKNKDWAIEAALKVKTYSLGSWVRKEGLYWENGCDFVLVTERELEK